MSKQEEYMRGPNVNLIIANVTAMRADLLRLALAGQETIQLLGYASTGDDLYDLLSENNPDVVLVGSSGSRKESTALPFLEQISTMNPTARPIVLSEDMSKEDIVSFFRSGARGLVCASETSVSILIKCIGCVSIGQVWANSDQLDRLLRSLSHPRSMIVANVMGDLLLSQREEQVLQLLADGLSNRDIAKTLKLSEHTVKNHLFHIFDKLGVSNRMEAVLYAISQREQRAVPSRVSSASGVHRGAA
jgi:DNA-binding NarL/FixJ family response regulator